MLKALPNGNGKVGVVGFCYGGGIANYLPTVIPDLAAAVAFYGAQPPAAEAAKIKTPLMIHDAEKDERIRAGWPAYEAALKAAGVHVPVLRLSRHRARLQQRHHAALRRGRRQAGVAAHRRFLQGAAWPA